MAKTVLQIKSPLRCSCFLHIMRKLLFLEPTAKNWQ